MKPHIKGSRYRLGCAARRRRRALLNACQNNLIFSYPTEVAEKRPPSRNFRFGGSRAGTSGREDTG